MNKQMKIAIGILAFLTLSTVVLLKLNQPSNDVKNAFLKEEKFVVVAGDTTTEVTMENFKDSVEIAANYKPSGKEPVTRIYNGITFAQLIENLQLDTAPYDSVVFTAIDGYATAINIKEALDAEKCAIVVGLEGEALGNKETGGSGPYMMILPKDQFSQRWCKFLAKVEFQ